MRRAFFTLALLLPLALAAADEFVAPPDPIQSPTLAPCMTCGGTGKRWTDNPGIKTNTSYRYADEDKRLSGAKTLRAQVTCNDCKGKGRLVRPLTPQEQLRMQRAQRQTFDTQCLSQGLIPVGNGYMSREVADALSPEAYATLAHAHPKPCSTCLGLKTEPCRKCKGERFIKSRDHYNDGHEAIIEEPCPQCSARGTLPCRKCEGEGLLKLCKRCQGTGIQISRATKKTAAAPERCRSCKGEGRR